MATRSGVSIQRAQIRGAASVEIPALALTARANSHNVKHVITRL